jgi:peptidyl-prolyl cis-trans isomerase SurA
MIWGIILAACLASGQDGALIVDRIAVIVGNQVIKTSDIDRDVRLTAFLNREKPNFSPDAKRKSAERLIDQTIIRQQIATGGYRRPSDTEADALLKQLRQDRFGGSEQQLRAALNSYGITEDQLRAHLLWQLTVIRFIDQRFRPGVLVTDEEVRAYYDQHLAELKREYPQNNSFEELAPKIRASLEGERINQSFAQWLDQARKRARIEYREAAFQ